MNGIFTPNHNTKESMYCDVCNAKMDVTRGVFGPTGFAESMAKKGHLYDLFTCPDKDADWHKQAYEVMREASNTKSGMLCKILKTEAAMIIKNRKTTKE
jgi:hypothetical protein